MANVNNTSSLDRSNGNPASSKSRPRFNFSNNWFEEIVPSWEALTQSLLPSASTRPLRILELGSFEGASATWILDNLAGHPSSTMVSIDTFEGGMEHGEEDKLESLEDRFRSNISKCSNGKKLRVIKARTDDGLLMLRNERAKFDFIYIDASHVAIDVLHDAAVAWQMLEVGGVLVFDDWTWKGYMEDEYNPRMAIMGFMQCVALEIRVEETESQIWLTRVENQTVATRNPDPSLMYWNKSERFIVDPSGPAKRDG